MVIKQGVHIYELWSAFLGIHLAKVIKMGHKFCEIRLSERQGGHAQLHHLKELRIWTFSCNKLVHKFLSFTTTHFYNCFLSNDQCSLLLVISYVLAQTEMRKTTFLWLVELVNLLSLVTKISLMSAVQPYNVSQRRIRRLPIKKGFNHSNGSRE